MDEEHDPSYVSGSTPRYNTKEVATRIAYMENAVLLLGSATPEIYTMYKAKKDQLIDVTTNVNHRVCETKSNKSQQKKQLM